MSIAGSASGNFTVEIWRKKRDQFNNIAKSNLLNNKNIGVLYGMAFSHEIHGVVIAPRTTEVVVAARHNNAATYTGKTLYCSPEDDISSDDYVVYKDYSGKLQVYYVEGEGNNDFVSPWSGFVGGKEVFLGRVESRRAQHP